MLSDVGKSIDGAVDIADIELAKRYGIDLTKISDTELYFAIPPAHSLFGKENITAEDFAGEKIIVLKNGRIPLWDFLIKSVFSEYPKSKPEYADTCGIKTFNFAETERKIIIATAYAKISIRILDISEWEKTTVFLSAYTMPKTRRRR